MEYFVSMNERELKAALLLLKCTALERVITVEDDFGFDEELIKTMQEKSFLREEDGQCKWNSFVHMILYIAVHAEGCMYQKQADGSICHFYYWNEEVVMLTKSAEDTQYIFYLVSLVPKMVGGFSKNYEYLENQMCQMVEYREERLCEQIDKCDSASILKVLQEREVLLTDADILVRFEACLNHKQYYAAVLAKNAEEKTILAMSDPWGIAMAEIDYFSMIQKISNVMIKLHGECIKRKGGK